MSVDTTTFLADAKNVYGAIQEQVNTKAVFMNLLGDGAKFGKINSLGIRGYTFLARLSPNWNMGYRLEGYTGVGNGIANAGNQGINTSTVLLKYAYVPTIITGQAEILTRGDGRAFMQAKALEAKFDMKDIIAHVNVVMVAAERGGNLATVLAAPAPTATTFSASTAGNLPGALYLRVGMPINTGPVGGGANNCVGTITSINYTTGAVTFTNTSGLPVAGDAVTLAGEAALTTGTFPVTSEGLISLATATGPFQGLDPSVAGNQAWQAYVQDMAAGTISAANFTALNQFVKMRSGEEIDLQLFPPAQINSLVSTATTTLAFQTQPSGQVGKKALDLGYTSYEFGGKTIVEEKDARNDRIWSMATSCIKKFEALPLTMADDEAGSWTRISGNNGPADAVMGILRWYHNLGILQRNALGLQKNYSVPTAFQNQPPNF